MLKPLSIVMIGTGNVAQHLVASFSGKAELKVVQVFNHRSTPQARALAKKAQAPFVSEYTKIQLQADIYLISVKDDALAEVAVQLSALGLKGLVLHTSGSVDVAVLAPVSLQTGVYYPLQTFSEKSAPDWQTTPLLIEATPKPALNTLRRLARSVSGTVKVVDSTTRLRLHLAAVFACNFTNALQVAAFGIIEAQLNIKDTALLMPMMQQSFLKLSIMSPRQAQTGPAMRHDQSVMKKHLTLLKQDKQLSAVYKLISELIQHQQKK